MCVKTCKKGFLCVAVASLLDFSAVQCRRRLLWFNTTLLLCWVLVSMKLIITSLSLS